MIYQRGAWQTYSPYQLLRTDAGSLLSLPFSSLPPNLTLFGRVSCLTILNPSCLLPLMVLSSCRLLLPKKKSTSVSATIPSLLAMGERLSSFFFFSFFLIQFVSFEFFFYRSICVLFLE